MSKLFSNNRAVIIPGLCCCLLLLSACASTARTENTVEKRATARWDALLSDDLAGAYEYLSPGFRSSVSSVQYQRSVLLKKVAWMGAQYIESVCAETTCKVKISLDYALYGGVPGVKSFEGTEMIEESWVLVDGVWYLVPGK
jgi:hypothetical protein